MCVVCDGVLTVGEEQMGSSVYWTTATLPLLRVSETSCLFGNNSIWGFNRGVSVQFTKVYGLKDD